MTPIDGNVPVMVIAAPGPRAGILLAPGADAGRPPCRIFQTLGTGVDQPCNLAKSVTVE